MIRIVIFFLLVVSCSPRLQMPDSEALKPAWLKTEPYQEGYYTGVGHSMKEAGNYIQAAKKSALDDLVSQIKVNVSSTSVLSTLERDKQFREQYEQIIQTTAADDIEEFELVDAWEDAGNYWVYYRLSITRYRQIKEEQKRNATILSTDYFRKGRQAEQSGEYLQALGFYFQAFRSIEKYLGEPVRVEYDGAELLLVNETYASIQRLLDKINLRAEPSEIMLNRRLNQTDHTVIVKAFFDDGNAATGLALRAAFEKGAGEIFPDYRVDENGGAKILLNRIGSRDLEQTIGIRVNIDAISGSGSSPVYALIAKTFQVPATQVFLRVQRPVVYLTADEKSLGSLKANTQITNKLKNLLANNGFEFTEDKNVADLWFDVKADSEKGSVTGSIYITYLTSVIRVTAMKEGKEIYATTLDRVKGYGLDYDKSSVDAYNKAMETLEKERVREIIATVLH
ncbi:MAG TPA: LPP20 family lipoprotein [Chryseosolibacter sp.]|nr:LPP20 family lipoprotein [Chryseosolibacter sp.]